MNASNALRNLTLSSFPDDTELLLEAFTSVRRIHECWEHSPALEAFSMCCFNYFVFEGSFVQCCVGVCAGICVGICVGRCVGNC